jgi:hypothetical protein
LCEPFLQPAEVPLGHCRLPLPARVAGAGRRLVQRILLERIILQVEELTARGLGVFVADQLETGIACAGLARIALQRVDGLGEHIAGIRIAHLLRAVEQQRCQ